MLLGISKTWWIVSFSESFEIYFTILPIICLREDGSGRNTGAASRPPHQVLRHETLSFDTLSTNKTVSGCSNLMEKTLKQTDIVLVPQVGRTRSWAWSQPLAWSPRWRGRSGGCGARGRRTCPCPPSEPRPSCPRTLPSGWEECYGCKDQETSWHWQYQW